MNSQFIESKLETPFVEDQIQPIEKIIQGSSSFTLSGMPGVGGSIFLRYLSLQTFAHFVYIDTYQLANITRLGYYQLLLQELGTTKIPNTEQTVLELCRKQLANLVKTNQRVVLILNRFDHLKNYFSNQLFGDLMSLHNVNTEKIVFIFTGNKPYIEILPNNITADKRNLFSKTVYLKPYTKPDLKQLLSISNNATIHSQDFINQALDLCGGHYQLLQLFLKSERLEPPFIDHFVKYQLKEIYDYLNYHQKKQLKKIVLGKNTESIDPYLLGVGLIKETNGQHELFTPIFAEFIRHNTSSKMSAKELKLFRLLKSHLGKLVTSEQIFAEVWSNDPDSASDWALSSLLYRLRKHPSVTSQNLIIENYKKQGYIMFKD